MNNSEDYQKLILEVTNFEAENVMTTSGEVNGKPGGLAPDLPCGDEGDRLWQLIGQLEVQNLEC